MLKECIKKEEYKCKVELEYNTSMIEEFDIIIYYKELNEFSSFGDKKTKNEWFAHVRKLDTHFAAKTKKELLKNLEKNIRWCAEEFYRVGRIKNNILYPGDPIPFEIFPWDSY